MLPNHCQALQDKINKLQEELTELRQANKALIEQSAYMHTKDLIKWITENNFTMEKWDKLSSVLMEIGATDLLDNICKQNNELSNVKENILTATNQWLQTNSSDIL